MFNVGPLRKGQWTYRNEMWTELFKKSSSITKLDFYSCNEQHFPALNVVYLLCKVKNTRNHIRIISWILSFKEQKKGKCFNWWLMIEYLNLLHENSLQTELLLLFFFLSISQISESYCWDKSWLPCSPMLSYDNALRSIGHGEICLGPVISVTLHIH